LLAEQAPAVWVGVASPTALTTYDHADE
jgi:hypothetical protein